MELPNLTVTKPPQIITWRCIGDPTALFKMFMNPQNKVELWDCQNPKDIILAIRDGYSMFPAGQTFVISDVEWRR